MLELKARRLALELKGRGPAPALEFEGLATCATADGETT